MLGKNVRTKNQQRAQHEIGEEEMTDIFVLYTLGDHFVLRNSFFFIYVLRSDARSTPHWHVLSLSLFILGNVFFSFSVFLETFPRKNFDIYNNSLSMHIKRQHECLRLLLLHFSNAGLSCRLSECVLLRWSQFKWTFHKTTESTKRWLYFYWWFFSFGVLGIRCLQRTCMLSNCIK